MCRVGHCCEASDKRHAVPLAPLGHHRRNVTPTSGKPVRLILTLSTFILPATQRLAAGAARRGAVGIRD